jgi:hypothetical protein
MISEPPFISGEAKQIVLTKMRVAAMQHAPGALVRDSLVADTFYDHMFDQLGFRLMAFVLGEQVGAHEHTVTFERPLTWWQHFKMSCMPEWFKRAFPVQFYTHRQTIHETVNATYPYANIAVPDLGQCVVFSTWTNKQGDIQS